MRIQKQRSTETRQLVYDTAMRLFLERGYENTSVDRIVAEAGVAKGTYFRYFPAKVSVLEHWAVEWFRDVAARAGVHDGAPLLNNALRLVGAMAATDRAYLTLTGWLVVESHAANLQRSPMGRGGNEGPPSKSGLNPMRDYLIDMIQGSEHTGPDDATALAEVLMNSWFGTILFCLDHPDRDPGAMLSRATRIWYGGVVGVEDAHGLGGAATRIDIEEERA